MDSSSITFIADSGFSGICTASQIFALSILRRAVSALFYTSPPKRIYRIPILLFPDCSAAGDDF